MPAVSSAIIIGATGLVGRECIRQLAAHPGFERVTALARRALPSDLVTAKVKTELVDFDRLDARPEVFQATHLFCALGTTIKQAGSQDRFRRVDFGYPLRAAKPPWPPAYATSSWSAASTPTPRRAASTCG